MEGIHTHNKKLVHKIICRLSMSTTVPPPRCDWSDALHAPNIKELN